MLENKLQAKIIELLEANGWYVLKLIQTNTPGIADLFCRHPNGRTVFLETKRPGKKATPLQEYRGKEVQKYGMEFYQADSKETFLMLGLV